MAITDVRTRIDNILKEDEAAMSDLLVRAISIALFLWWCIHKVKANTFHINFGKLDQAVRENPKLLTDPDFKAVYENLKAFEERKRYPEEVNEITMKIARSFRRIRKRYPQVWAQAEDKVREDY